jgi:large subunit ribosomal protein L7/L12
MNLEEIGDAIANLTLKEARQLSDYLKDEHGIEPPAATPTFIPSEPQKTVETAPTEFDVVLEGYDDKDKIKVIKVVRAETSLGLREAKEAVEKAPYTLREAVSQEEADRILNLLKEAGATAKSVPAG